MGKATFNATSWYVGIQSRIWIIVHNLDPASLSRPAMITAPVLPLSQATYVHVCMHTHECSCLKVYTCISAHVHMYVGNGATGVHSFRPAQFKPLCCQAPSAPFM